MSIGYAKGMKEKTTRSKSDFYGACRLRTAVEFKFGCVYEYICHR